MGILYAHWPWIASAAGAYVAIAILSLAIDGSRRGRQEKQAEADYAARHRAYGIGRQAPKTECNIT
jgi:hypothetical protein